MFLMPLGSTQNCNDMWCHYKQNPGTYEYNELALEMACMIINLKGQLQQFLVYSSLQ